MSINGHISVTPDEAAIRAHVAGDGTSFIHLTAPGSRVAVSISAGGPGAGEVAEAAGLRKLAAICDDLAAHLERAPPRSPPARKGRRSREHRNRSLPRG